MIFQMTSTLLKIVIQTNIAITTFRRTQVLVTTIQIDFIEIPLQMFYNGWKLLLKIIKKKKVELFKSSSLKNLNHLKVETDI